MSAITCMTRDHKLIILNTPLLVSGSKSADIIHIKFDESWDFPDSEKYIQFLKDGETFTFELYQNSSTVPQEVLSSPGRFSFAVFMTSGGRVVKTSAFCTAAVLPGPDTENTVLVDWNMFFLRLISSLNETFGLSLNELDSPDSVLSAVSALQNPAAVKSFFVSLFRFVGFMIDDTMSDDDISLNITTQNDRNVSYAQYYPELQANLLRIIQQYVDAEASTDNDIIPPELEWLIQLEDYLQAVPTPEEAALLEADRQTMYAVKTVYENFYIGAETNGNT